MTPTIRVISESEATAESFHDCHVHGIHWRRDQFTFSMDVQYILKWIEPTNASDGYRFSIAEGRLTFQSVDDLKVTMDWSGAALDAQIAAMRILKTRDTPGGAIQRNFEIEFSDPDAVISLWSTGYAIHVLQQPVLSETTSIPLPE